MIATQPEPIYGFVEDSPNEILLHAMTAIRFELGAEVDADTAGRNLQGELGRAFDIAFGVEAGLAAKSWCNEQDQIRLRLIAVVNPNGIGDACQHAGCMPFVKSQPGAEVGMRTAVLLMAKCGG